MVGLFVKAENTDFACKSAVGERSFMEGRVSYGKFLCNHLFTALAVVQQYGGVDASKATSSIFYVVQSVYANPHFHCACQLGRGEVQLAIYVVRHVKSLDDAGCQLFG